MNSMMMILFAMLLAPNAPEFDESVRSNIENLHVASIGIQAKQDETTESPSDLKKKTTASSDSKGSGNCRKRRACRDRCRVKSRCRIRCRR